MTTTQRPRPFYARPAAAVCHTPGGHLAVGDVLFLDGGAPEGYAVAAVGRPMGATLEVTLDNGREVVTINRSEHVWIR